MRARSRSSRAAILAFGLVACRPSSGPVEVTPEPRSVEPPRSLEAPAPAWAPLPSTIRWPSGALAIELPPGEPAPWLLPTFEPGLGHPLDRLSVVAYGERIALARHRSLLLATDRDEGLLGTISLPPDIDWIGVGGGDRIFAADPRGRLFTADTVARALEHGLEPTGAVLDGATWWDAAGECVLAVVGSAVMVSEDGGRTFRSTVPARGQALANAVVRPDGVMVALSKEFRAHVSPDGGRTWRRSTWHPDSLWREGAWIMGWRGDLIGALSSDGRSWAGGLDHELVLRSHRSWSTDFGSHRLEPQTGPWLTPTDPPAPPPPARPLRSKSRARDGSTDSLTGVMGGLIGGGFLESASCERGLACLHGAVGDAPPPSRLDVRVFGDSRCAIEAASCPQEHWRMPHVGVFDHAEGRLHLGRMPRACTRVDVADARGLGLVSCWYQDSASIIVVEPDGTAHVELEVGTASPGVSYVMMAEDGTVLVPESPTCGQWARAWVRRPVAPGTPEAWTLVELPGARTWRPVGRGYAVAVADHPEGGGRLADLWLAGPKLEPTRLVESIPVLVDVTDVRVDDGRVSLHADRWQVVRHDASLAEVELPSRVRVVDGMTMTRARPWLGGCPDEPMQL